MHSAFGVQWIVLAMASAAAAVRGHAQWRRGRSRAKARSARARPDDAPDWHDHIAFVSHELRTPLAALSGMLELLGRSHELSGDAHDTLSRAQDCAAHMRALLDDLLEASRPGTSSFPMRPEPVLLPAVIEDIVSTFRPMAAARALQISFAGPPSPGCERSPYHHADPARIRQILANLLANAIRFSTIHPIAVTCERHGVDATRDRFVIRVADRGAGIHPDDLGRLFTPFVQARPRSGMQDPAAGNSGSGLGLYIARQLARGMDGDVALSSATGTGTIATVTLTLPRVALPEPRRTARPPVQHERKRARVPHALVVDDHPAGRALLMQQLQHLGVDSIGVASGEEALAAWQSERERFSVLIADCMLPGIGGFELTRRIRALEYGNPGPRLTILGYSADARPEQQRRALGVGMDEYLSKPIGLDRLGDTLRNVQPGNTLPARQGPVCAVAPRRINGRAELQAATDNGFQDQPVVDLLLAANRADLAALEHAATRFDLPRLQAIAHRLAGVASLAGAAAVVRQGEALEAACRAGEPVRIRACVPALGEAVAAWNVTLLDRGPRRPADGPVLPDTAHSPNPPSSFGSQGR